jgi:hypothetical protein
MPGMKDKIKKGIGAAFGQFYSPPGPAQQVSQPSQQAASAPGNNSVGVKHVQAGNTTLITSSPEEVLHQVERRRSGVSFGLSGTAKFMENFNQMWSWAGPILFAIGTIGEIFIVLWERQKAQNWFTGFTIVAVSMIAEGTLLAVSFASKRLRNKADKRSTGWTEQEKHKLSTLKQFWFALAVGVAATQVAFVVAQTDPTTIGIGGVWAVAITRSLVALVADCYTAFASEEKPTTGEQALDELDKETQFTKKLLDQEAVKVELINAGSIAVQEVAIKAEMAQDKMETHKEIERLQNKAQIDTMRAQHEQNILMDRMRNSAMRAIFDPEMPAHEKQAILTALSALGEATKGIPATGYSISEDAGGNVRQLKGL